HRGSRSRVFVSRAAFDTGAEAGAIPAAPGTLTPGPLLRGSRQRRNRRGGGGDARRKRSWGCAGVRAPTAVRMATDLYEVLSVPDTADDKEIKRAYRRKALQTHPDVNTSPNAKTEFAEVVNAYEVLSDQKKRQAYDRKRKYTPPFGGVRDAASGATSWGRSAYDGARKEASRRWKEQNPGPQDIDDSFGDILRDLFGGITAGGGRGVLNDLVDFLENRVEGFSSDTSVEFEDLMSSGSLEEMEAELENTRLLLEQLRKRSGQLNRDRQDGKRGIRYQKEVSAMKAAGEKRFANIDELDRQMAAVEKAAGIKARFEEIQGHLKRGTRSPSSPSSTAYSSSNPGTSSTAEAAGRGARGTRSVGDPRRASSSSSTTVSGGSSSNSGTPGSVAKAARPPPPRVSRTAPGGRRRADDPEVEAELARLKRKMGL
ncbi:unnamed protein product, partial [Ascophyllum nodosum]